MQGRPSCLPTVPPEDPGSPMPVRRRGDRRGQGHATRHSGSVRTRAGSAGDRRRDDPTAPSPASRLFPDRFPAASRVSARAPGRVAHGPSVGSRCRIPGIPLYLEDRENMPARAFHFGTAPTRRGAAGGRARSRGAIRPEARRRRWVQRGGRSINTMSEFSR
jgi:hypothetical protein